MRAAQAYNAAAASGNADRFGKKFFANVPLQLQDSFHVAIVCPVLHYTMGGVAVSPKGEVLGVNGPIPGLYAAGEVAGGVHGRNRLGGEVHTPAWHTCIGRRELRRLSPLELESQPFAEPCSATTAVQHRQLAAGLCGVRPRLRCGGRRVPPARAQLVRLRQSSAAYGHHQLPLVSTQAGRRALPAGRRLHDHAVG